MNGNVVHSNISPSVNFSQTSCVNQLVVSRILPKFIDLITCRVGITIKNSLYVISSRDNKILSNLNLLSLKYECKVVINGHNLSYANSCSAYIYQRH